MKKGDQMQASNGMRSPKQMQDSNGMRSPNKCKICQSTSCCSYLLYFKPSIHKLDALKNKSHPINVLPPKKFLSILMANSDAKLS